MQTNMGAGFLALTAVEPSLRRSMWDGQLSTSPWRLDDHQGMVKKREKSDKGEINERVKRGVCRGKSFVTQAAV